MSNTRELSPTSLVMGPLLKHPTAWRAPSLARSPPAAPLASSQRAALDLHPRRPHCFSDLDYCIARPGSHSAPSKACVLLLEREQKHKQTPACATVMASPDVVAAISLSNLLKYVCEAVNSVAAAYHRAPVRSPGHAQQSQLPQ